MKLWKHTALAKPAALALAIAAAYPAVASAQSNEELLKELRALKDRVGELEKKLADKPAAGAAGTAQWGMTPEQVQDFNRIAVKTEGIEDAVEAQGLKNLKIGGYFDPTYIYNKAQNRAGFQFLNRVSDDGYNYDNSYFGTVNLDFQKEMEGGTKWRLTLMPNRGAGAIADSTGNSIVHEASVSIPLGDLQTRFIGGQIPDWSGYEYIQATTTKLVTRGMLLDFTEPTAYTAAGMEIIRGKWDVKAVLGNYNQTKQSANRKSPVLAYRADYSNGEFVGFGFAGVHGKAVNFSPLAVDANGKSSDSQLDLFEMDAYFIRGPDLARPGRPRPPEGGVDHGGRRWQPARFAVVGGVGVGRLQVHPALGSGGALRLHRQPQERRGAASVLVGRWSQRHRPGHGARRRDRHLGCG